MRFKPKEQTSRSFEDNERMLRIVTAAKDVFLESGDSAFTIRNVARMAGMSMGAVQHFYPTRDRLLAAMLEYTATQYRNAYQRVLRKVPDNGEARLEATLNYLITDAMRPQTRRFFFALWALSCHNPIGARLVHQMYDHYRQNLATFIRAARPTLPSKRCGELALFVGSTIEGLTVLTGPVATAPAAAATLRRNIAQSILEVIHRASEHSPIPPRK